MWSSLNASLKEVLFDAIVGLKGSNKSTSFIHVDDLSKNPSRKKVKKGDLLASNYKEPLLCKEEDNVYKKKNLEKRSYGGEELLENGVIRVKVKMTKQEAARLMSKCKDGGILSFRDVAHELLEIPVDHVLILYIHV
ncbi:hypothetical protein JCGZ_08892 [Jatropha curcas]|uniref:DUF7890 domain-containing protein n=1 Tax=Jatropha curcas TaxID=180498 RepID=A0A067KXS3_JATCU|nr:hypothetical protein JCGZ_08892 [Jatropha curcas]